MRRISSAAPIWIVSPRLLIDLPFLRCVVRRSHTVDASASTSRRTISSTSAGVSGVWFVCLSDFPLSGNSVVTVTQAASYTE